MLWWWAGFAASATTNAHGDQRHKRFSGVVFSYHLSASQGKAPFSEFFCIHDSPVILRGKRFQLKECGMCKSTGKMRVFVEE